MESIQLKNILERGQKRYNFFIPFSKLISYTVSEILMGLLRITQLGKQKVHYYSCTEELMFIAKLLPGRNQ